MARPQVPDDSRTQATGGAAVEMSIVMIEERQYRITATAALWFRIVAAGGAGAAVDGVGSHFLAAGQSALIGKLGSRDRVSVIQDTGAGKAIVSELAGSI